MHLPCPTSRRHCAILEEAQNTRRKRSEDYLKSMKTKKRRELWISFRKAYKTSKSIGCNPLWGIHITCWCVICEFLYFHHSSLLLKTFLPDISAVVKHPSCNNNNNKKLLNREVSVFSSTNIASRPQFELSWGDCLADRSIKYSVTNPEPTSQPLTLTL